MKQAEIDNLFLSALLPKNSPGPHLFEIAQRLGPLYQKVARKENFPTTPKGLLGVGNYTYKTNVNKKSSLPNLSTTANLQHNKSCHVRSRKLSSRLDDHIHDEDLALDEDLDDSDIAHLGDDIDGIDIDDTEFEDGGGGTGGKFRVDDSTDDQGADVPDSVLTPEDEAW